MAEVERKILTRPIADGKFQAFLEGGTGPQLGVGDTPEAAIKNLEESLNPKAPLPGSVPGPLADPKPNPILPTNAEFKASVEHAANVGDTKSPPTGTVGNAKPDDPERIKIQQLASPVTINGVKVTMSAFRLGNPAVQGYGSSPTSAKVDLLTKERDAKKQPVTV